MLYWPEQINRGQNDEAPPDNGYSRPDYLAGIASVMAISKCSHLRADFAYACGSSPSHCAKHIPTQVCDTSPFDFALSGRYGHLWFLNLSGGPIIVRGSAAISSKNIAST
jgi:hypothetical protein